MVLDESVLKQLFIDARSQNGWLDKEVSDELLRKIYDVMKFAPTSANCSPMRIVFIKSKEAKEKLKPCLAPGNVDKAMAAPVMAIFGDDFKFYDHLPKLFPHTDAKAWFEGNHDLINSTALRNGTLQAAYFMIVARAFGLDIGPMSGFDNAKVDDLFFKGTSIKSNFICGLGYGDVSKLFARLPRFDFADICKVL